MEEEDIEIKLPKLGESIVSATIVTWLKKEGDFVNLDEPLLEVSTDKVNSEIPSPVAGILKSIHVEIDREIDVGTLIAIITTSAPRTGSVPPPTGGQEKEVTLKSDSTMKGFFTPSVLRFAREKGIDLNELETISASGAGGRLSKKDLEDYLESREASAPIEKEALRIPLTSVRKSTAKNMACSAREIPHATLIIEVDVNQVMQRLAEAKKSFLEKHGCKLSITSVIARALSRAVKTYPLVNASFEEDAILLKQRVNLGIAVSVGQGVVVPVIRDCQDKGIVPIAKEIAYLAERARASRLTLQDIQGGTITLTNFGMSNVLIGLPIIRLPEVAIIGVGAIQKKVVVLEEEQMAVRSMMMVSLTFDHRVIDGMYGCDFLGAIKRDLEQGIDYPLEEE